MREKLKRTMIMAAREAGKIQKRYFFMETSQKEIKLKKWRNLVTKADLESEKKIISTIKKGFPSHGILSEESGHEKSSSDYLWVIDPLDGTHNFLKGLELFCVSIAVSYKKNVIMGAAFDPMRNHLYFAERGKGAFLNGKRIHVSEDKDFDTCLMFTPCGPAKNLRKRRIEIAYFKEMIKKAFGQRAFHSLVLELCYVAKGSAGGVLEGKTHPWDFAAAALILEEAGGRVTDTEGKPWNLEMRSIVASNKLLHNKLMRIVGKAR